MAPPETAQQIMDKKQDPAAAETARTTDSPAVDPSTTCCASSLLDWLDDNACELVAESYPIADTGDYDGAWVVYNEPSPVNAINRSSKPRQPMGWGRTPAAAIRDAMKGPEDPTKYDYVPPEFRHNDEPMRGATGTNMK